MNNFKKLILAIALGSSFCTAAFATTQSTSHSGTDQFWNVNPSPIELGSITFVHGTNNISVVNGSGTLYDQGWGGSDPSNGVYIGLFSNNQNLLSYNVMGAGHTSTAYTFNLANNPAWLSNLNTTLRGIDQSSNPLISMKIYTNAWGYPGWELHTRNVAFSVSSSIASLSQAASISAVPEPETYGMLLAGLGMLGFMGRRKAR